MTSIGKPGPAGNKYKTQSKAKDQKVAQTMTPRQHHNKAVKIHAQASAHHSQAARSLESGDLKASALHAQLADEYEAQATEHDNFLERPPELMEQNKQVLEDSLMGALEQEVAIT